MQQIISEARQAVERGDLALARDVLLPLADECDVDAQIFLGTSCSFEPATYDEAERWLHPLADATNGHAAHNLAMLIGSGWPCREPVERLAAKYMRIAVQSGFEASVTRDPFWWKRPR